MPSQFDKLDPEKKALIDRAICDRLIESAEARLTDEQANSLTQRLKSTPDLSVAVSTHKLDANTTVRLQLFVHQQREFLADPQMLKIVEFQEEQKANPRHQPSWMVDLSLGLSDVRAKKVEQKKNEVRTFLLDKIHELDKLPVRDEAPDGTNPNARLPNQVAEQKSSKSK